MLKRSLNLINLSKLVPASGIKNIGRCALFQNVLNFSHVERYHINIRAIQNAALQQRNFHLCYPSRKYNKTSADTEGDSDDELDAEFKDERDSKVVKVKVNSLRADLLLKAGLGLARNKIEAIFYESKIRVNGKKLLKKSLQLNVGDEIDVIKGFSQTNPAHIIIGRVIILSASEREEGLLVHLRRYKTLLIENYAGPDAYKSSDANAQLG